MENKPDRIDWKRTCKDLEAECQKVPDGYVLVPMEPTASQLDVAVSFALNVKLCNDYNWSAYMRDVYARMISAAPKPEKAEPDCECGAVASEHCPACEPVAQVPGLPFPMMQEAFEAYYSQSFTDRDWRRESGVWAAAWKAAIHYVENQKPVAQGPVAYRWYETKFEEWRYGEAPMDQRTCEPLYAAPPDLAAEVDRLEVSAALDKDDARERIAELEAIIEAQRTLYANCIKISHEADELEHKCNGLERQQKVLVEALEEAKASFVWMTVYTKYPCHKEVELVEAALASVKGNA